MDHQQEGVSFLLSEGSGIVAFEQGLGKTLVAIDAFSRLRDRGAVERLFVICPNSLKRNWGRELGEFAPDLLVDIVGGSARERRETLARTSAAVVIVNYEAARIEISGIRALLQRVPTVLVLDESHHVKNKDSLTSIATRHFAPVAAHRWLLSGTPVTNCPGDIWAQVNIVSGGTRPLGSFDRFMLDYGEADQDKRVQEKLADTLAPYLMRRTKEECLDLPEKTFVDLYVELPPWQRELYDGVRDGIIREVQAMDSNQFRSFAITALTRLLRLAQVASNPALVFDLDRADPGKQSRLDDVLRELVRENGRKVLIWSCYVATIEGLLERYESYGAVALYGGVPADTRQEVVRDFQEDPGTRVLIANPAVAGTGFNLTAASYAIYESLNWRYDLYAQSQDRNHRIGQELPVTYLRLLAEDTIDEVIVSALERKRLLARGVVGDEADQSPVSQMTPESFCRMLRTNRLP